MFAIVSYGPVFARREHTGCRQRAKVSARDFCPNVIGLRLGIETAEPVPRRPVGGAGFRDWALVR